MSGSAFFGSNAAQGDPIIGGGVGVVCRSPQGAVLSAEVLDLYEGRVQQQLRFSSEALSANLRVEMSQTRMISHSGFLTLFQSEVGRIRAEWEVLPHLSGTPPIPDAFPPLSVRGCDFEGVVEYSSAGKIQVDRKIYQRLSLINRAALLMHETIYKMARTQVQAASSAQVRRLVAQLLAENPNTSLISDLMAQLISPPAPPVVPTVITQWNGLWIHVPTAYCAERIIADPIRNQIYSTAERNPVSGNTCGESGRVLTANCTSDGRECTFRIYNDVFTIRLIDESHYSMATNGIVTDTFRKYSN